MFKTKQNITPTIFQQKFKIINHKYPTNQKLKSSQVYISRGKKQITLPLFHSFKILLKTNY